VASPRILVTNDDGVHAPGILALTRSLVEAGHDVTVVAPRDERSGSGAGIGPVHLTDAMEYETLVFEGLADVPVYFLDAPPALCVLTARLGAFGPSPELVVAGINPGPNTGRAVLHSGTVGAAFTAANVGLSGLAVSMATGEPMHWSTAGALAVSAVEWLLDARPRTILNLNVPNLPLDDVLGVRLARLAAFGTVRAALAHPEPGSTKVQIQLQETDEVLDPDTDTALVNAGYAAITSLVGPHAAGDEPDVAEHLARMVGGGGPPQARSRGVR
jgi:5'-nucleotidase